ncbi:hypothetical protein [Klebsiella pneumoniae]|uniref:hypothetical protein n=1 Tax=Klebsiella pneumoniae TaxID=573 RepID=UPI00388EEFBD
MVSPDGYRSSRRWVVVNHHRVGRSASRPSYDIQRRQHQQGTPDHGAVASNALAQ